MTASAACAAHAAAFRATTYEFCRAIRVRVEPATAAHGQPFDTAHLVLRMDHERQGSPSHRDVEPGQRRELCVPCDALEDRHHPIRPFRMARTLVSGLVVVADERQGNSHACATVARTSSIRSWNILAARAAPSGAEAIPRLTDTMMPRPRASSPRADRFFERPALGTDPREQQRCIRRSSADRHHRIGTGRPHDEADAPARIPGEAELNDARAHRHSRLETCVEQVDGAGIAAPRDRGTRPGPRAGGTAAPSRGRAADSP